MHPIIVAVRGPSGAGKTTAVAALSRTPGWSPLDEAFYRLRPKPGLRIASQRQLVNLELRLLEEEARRFGDACALVSAGRTVVADTGFLDPVEYTFGLLLLGVATPSTFRTVVRRARDLAVRHRLGVADLTVHLAVSPGVRAARTAADPTGHPRVYRDRHERVGRLVTRAVVPSLRAVLPGRVRVVRASRPAGPVAGRIRTLARRTPPLRDRATGAIGWLDRLERLPAVRTRLTSGASPRRRPPRGSRQS